MPISSVFYINGPTLASSTAVYDNAEMTILAADGYYSDTLITRQQVGGVLLPAQACPNCTIFEYDSSTNATITSELSCENAIDTVYYCLPVSGVSGPLAIGDAVFFDNLGENPLYDGWYLTNSEIVGCTLAYRVQYGLVTEFVNCCANPETLCYSTVSLVDATCGCLT